MGMVRFPQLVFNDDFNPRITLLCSDVDKISVCVRLGLDVFGENPNLIQKQVEIVLFGEPWGKVFVLTFPYLPEGDAFQGGQVVDSLH